MVLEPVEDTILALLRDGSGRVVGDIESAGEETSGWAVGGVGS